MRNKKRSNTFFSKRKKYLFNFGFFLVFSYISALVLNKSLYGSYFPEKINKCQEITDSIFGFRIICNKSQSLGLTNQYSLKKQDLNNFNILIIGGSVAEDLHTDSSFNKLIREAIVKENPRVEASQINVFNSALPGGKQPQGLFTLKSLEMLGYEFDLIIELSGFNEMVLAIGENFSEYGINPIYPRAQNLRTIYTADYIKNGPLSKIINIHPFTHTLKKSGIWDQSRRFFQQNTRKSSSTKLFMDFFMPENIDEASELAKKIYQESVENIYYHSQRKGSQYILVLQPSHHLKNSKILSDDEKKLFYTSNHVTPWAKKAGEIINKTYSSIDKSTFNIPESNLVDLRGIFKENSDTLYIDECCHLNKEGMNLLSKEIIKVINPHLKTHKKYNK